MTSSNENISALLALCVTGEFPPQRPVFSLICAWTNRWVNSPNAGGSKRYSAYYDVAVIYRSPPRQFHIIATIIN